MPDKFLPDEPKIEQYKKQAKDLLHAHAQPEPAALDRIARHHPRLRNQPLDTIRLASFQLTMRSSSSPASTVSKAGRSSAGTSRLSG